MSTSFPHITPFLAPALQRVYQQHPDLLRTTDRLHNGPVHIVAPEVMEKAIEELRTPLDAVSLEYRIHYAHKSNKSLALLSQAQRSGIHCDVASLQELQNALTVGFTGAQISCTGPKDTAFLKLAIAHQCLISIDSINELERIIAQSTTPLRSVDILLRCNDLQAPDRLLTQKWTRFGIAQDQLPRVLSLLALHTHIQLRGIHIHYDEANADIKAGSAHAGITLLQELYKHGHRPHILNIGGGFRAKELAESSQWYGYIDRLASAQTQHFSTDTWGDRGYGLHRNSRGGIEGREQIQSRHKEVSAATYLETLLACTDEHGYSVTQRLQDNMFTLMIEPGYALTVHTTCSILHVIATQEIQDGSPAVILNSNVVSMGSRMWEQYANPLLLSEQTSPQDWYGYLLGNLCREDDILMQRKVHFSTTPQIGDALLIANTGTYSADFEEATPISQPLGKKYILCHDGDKPYLVAEHRKNYTVIDIRGNFPFSIGHVNNSINIIDETFAQMIEEGPVFPKQQEIVVACRIGDISQKYAQFLRNQGYIAYSLRGGITAWKQQGLPLDTFI